MTGSSTRRAVVVAVAVAGLLAIGPDGRGDRAGAQATASPPAVDVTPNVALADFQPVTLTGSGFEPGLYEWFECRGGAVDESDCDGYNADFASVGSDGTLSETVYVDARIYLPDGTEVDCRTDASGCVIGVGFLVDAGEWPAVHLNFDPDAALRAPVAATAEPSTGLEDGDEVTLDGRNLSFREEAWAYLCREGDGAVGTRCDLDRAVRSVPAADGTVTLTLTVRGAFDPPLGGHVDCRTPGASCVAVVGWSFSPPPDRVASVPITFAPADTTTTSIPSTAPPSPPPPPPPDPRPAPPAAPVGASASYTG